MTLASASRRGLPKAAGVAPGVVNAVGLCSAVVGGTTGGYSGYCGCAWVCVCSYQSGAMCCDPSSGGCDGGCCVIGISLGSMKTTQCHERQISLGSGWQSAVSAFMLRLARPGLAEEPLMSCRCGAHLGVPAAPRLDLGTQPVRFRLFYRGLDG